MTCRRGKLIEDGARELLQVCGYTVEIVPFGYHKRYPPAHLVASLPSGETRLIIILKISHCASSPEILAKYYPHEIRRYHRYLANHPGCENLHCEIWMYSLSYGFRCFEILPGTIREIQKPSPVDPKVSLPRGRT